MLAYVTSASFTDNLSVFKVPISALAALSPAIVAYLRSASVADNLLVFNVFTSAFVALRLVIVAYLISASEADNLLVFNVFTSAFVALRLVMVAYLRSADDADNLSVFQPGDGLGGHGGQIQQDRIGITALLDDVLFRYTVAELQLHTDAPEQLLFRFIVSVPLIADTYGKASHSLDLLVT